MKQFPSQVKEIREGIYVDDINMGGNSIAEVKKLKEASIIIFEAGWFTLHKWHSNMKELEGEFQNNDDSTFAKKAWEQKHLR